LGTVELTDQGARGGERCIRERRAVGTHVGDETVLVEALRGAHRAGGRVTELSAGLLLEGRGHEGRRGAAAVRLAFDGGDASVAPFEGARELVRFLLGEEADVLLELAGVVEVLPCREALAVDAGQGRGET